MHLGPNVNKNNLEFSLSPGSNKYLPEGQIGKDLVSGSQIDLRGLPPVKKESSAILLSSVNRTFIETNFYKQGFSGQTLAIWVKSYDLISTRSFLIGLISEENEKEFSICIGNEEESTKAGVRVNGSFIEGNGTIIDKKWHLISLVRARDYLKIYIDNFLDKIINVNEQEVPYLNSELFRLWIGHNPKDQRFCDVALSKVFVYNEAKTLSEIKNLYNLYKSKFKNANSLSKPSKEESSSTGGDLSYGLGTEYI